jgi:predicted PurR-regulated permease PerM
MPAEGDEVAPPRRRDDAMPRWVPRAILLVFACVVGLYVAAWLFTRLRSLLVILLISLFLSFALEPAVNYLQGRGWRRGVATAAVFVGAVAAFGVFLFLMGQLLVDQVVNLVDEAPEYIEETESWVNETFDADVNADDLVQEFQEGGAAGDFAQDLAGNIVTTAGTVLNVLFQALTILLFTFYLVADGPRLRRSLLSAINPERQREVLRVWDIAIEKTGGYIYSRALLAGFSALFSGIAFAIIGVPFPVPLALWVGIFSQFVPVIGTYIAGALPIAIALIADPIDALWVLGVILVYQQVENYVFAPRITAQTMDIHPAVAFGGVIAGAALLGPVGALLALPAAATLQAFVSTYVTRHEVVESPLTRHQRPRARWGAAIRARLSRWDVLRTEDGPPTASAGEEQAERAEAREVELRAGSEAASAAAGPAPVEPDEDPSPG